MQVQDYYDLNIYIDGINICDTPGVIFIRGEIYEALMNPIPTCELELSVPVGWIDYRSIVDGTKIRFEIKSSYLKINETYEFRLFNVTNLELNQQYANLLLEGVIDFYPGYTQGNNLNANCTTSEIFKKVANLYGLNAEIDQTNDKQLWVAGENNIYQFFTLLTQRAWIDQTSSMFWCIDRYKNLLFKNLTSLFRNRQENVWSFIQSERVDLSKKQYSYTSSKASILAGTNNLKNGGYGGVDYRFDLLDYRWNEAAAKKVVAESNLINISKELSQGLVKTWYPFDVGNFHPNYDIAYKQNKRILSTYSSYMQIECQYFQPYRIGQIVNFEYLDAQDLKNHVACLSGTYIIDAIHIEMLPSSITSTVEIVMQGLNGKAITQEVY